MEDNVLIYAILLLVALLTLAWITRLIFSIPKQLKYQETIVGLLMKIASGETLSKEQADAIKSYLSR